MVDYYDYAELRKAALAEQTEQAINKLGQWFDNYGTQFWNGEYYDADNGVRIYPVYSEENEDGDAELTGYRMEE